MIGATKHRSGPIILSVNEETSSRTSGNLASCTGKMSQVRLLLPSSQPFCTNESHFLRPIDALKSNEQCLLTRFVRVAMACGLDFGTE